VPHGLVYNLGFIGEQTKQGLLVTHAARALVNEHNHLGWAHRDLWRKRQRVIGPNLDVYLDRRLLRHCLRVARGRLIGSSMGAAGYTAKLCGHVWW
jgi:hypothetical protein